MNLTPFPQGAGTTMACIEAGDVAAADGLHHARHAAGLRWCHQQVHVVGHQHVGVQGAPVLERGFAQFLPVVQVVRGVSEAGLAVDAALDDVLRHAGEIDAWLSGHVVHPEVDAGKARACGIAGGSGSPAMRRRK
jgi:hypothetical protein